MLRLSPNKTLPTPPDNPISENNQTMRLNMKDPGLRSIGFRVNPSKFAYAFMSSDGSKKSTVIACYCTNLTLHYGLGLSPKEA